MSEQDHPNPDPAVVPPEADEAAIEAEVKAIAGEKPKDPVTDALIATKRELRSLNRRVKELDATAQEATTLKERLAAAQPYIDALVGDANLRAQALRRVKGGPVEPQDDAEAKDYAELHGLYLNDGATPNVQKARQLLDWHDARDKKRTESIVGPLAGLVAGSKAEQNIVKAIGQTDESGVPYASAESIRDVAAQLPPHLLADERVIDLVLNNAIGLDRRKGRTPKAVDEPLYLDTPHGRGKREAAVDPTMKAMLDRLGLTEAEFTESGTKLEQAVATRKGLALGRK